MAKKKAKYDWGRSGSGRYQKFETKVKLKWTAVDGSSSPYQDSAYIDVAQCLSGLNRKLVRQGQVFKIKGMRAYTNDAEDNPSMIKIGVLPRIWPMFNAYKKARALWNEHNLKAMQGIGAGNLPKYYDFKVLLDGVHAQNLLTDKIGVGSGAGSDGPRVVDFADAELSSGDWAYSKIHTADDSTGESYDSYIHMLGGHRDSNGDKTTDQITPADWDRGSVGAIEAYSLSRGSAHLNTDASGLEQQTVDKLRFGPFGTLMSSSDQKDETINTLVDRDNDDPPYPVAMVGGSAEHADALCVYYGKLGQRENMRTIPSFEAPLGLIRIEADGHDSAPADDIHIMFDVEIMGDM